MQTITGGHGATLTAAKVIPFPDQLPARELPVQFLSKDAGGLRSFDRDQEIFGEGDPADYYYKVVSGAVRTYKVLSDGRRQIDAFHLPGDMFGIEAGCEHRFSAEAIKDVTVRAIRRRGLGKLAQSDNDVATRLIDAMAQALERAQDHMLLLGRKCAREKIASFLLGLAGRVRGTKTIELPMSRTDIADHLGLTIETVSRTLTQLQREKLIELPSTRRVIVLRDLAALRQLDAGDMDRMPLRLGHKPAAQIGCRPH